jgi:hypothetical protein
MAFWEMSRQSALAMDTGETLPRLVDVVDLEAFSVFSVDRYVALIWKHPPTMGGVEHCQMVFEKMEGRSPEKFGYLAIVEPKAGSNMPGDVRTKLSAMLKQHQRHIAASLIVFEGTGFGASIVRSVVSAINLATRIEFPAKVESSLYPGTMWLTQYLRNTSSVSAGALTSVVNDFRRRWRPSVPPKLRASGTR